MLAAIITINVEQCFRSTFVIPPPFVIATPKYGINTVPTPTVAITRAWLAHDTYNYRHTRERMHGMSELVQKRGR